MKLLDGKALSEEIKNELKNEVQTLLAAGKRAPHLAAVLVGNDAASKAYVGSKVRFCEAVGFNSSLIELSAETSENELMHKIDQLNTDNNIDGFIVQLPLPKHISETKVIERIDYRKDVDGFHPVNVGRMALNLPSYVSATPLGIVEMLRRSEIDISGKEVVVLGRSNIVGSPMSILLSKKASPGNATVTLCHSRTKNLEEHCKRADVLVAALGKAEFVKAEMVKSGAIVIDVGINRIEDATKKRGYRLVGDVAFEEVAPKCSYITPVPGGVGRMTVASLLLNTLKATKKEIYP